VLTPLAGIMLASDSTLVRVLGVAMLLHIPSTISIALNVHRTLRDSIAAAETSARLAEKMQHLARTDVVTGLLNRAGLNHFLVEHLSRKASGSSLALFWFDLDRFKEVNDALGHQVGDRVLTEVAQRLRTQAKTDAVIGRFGGDEFILACSVKDRREVEAIALALLGEVTRPLRLDDDRLEISCSMGVAVMPEDGGDLDAVMQAADLALYHAKVGGRKQVSFYEPSMSRDLTRRREIEAELRVAVQRDELSTFFQPIVDLETGRIRAFEALVRWFHPVKGELRPDEFIPVAEETGAIITLGNWITAQAAKAAAQWPDDVTVAVNLSPLQIKAPGAAMGILNALREARLREDRARRFRHRLLLARLSEQVSVRQDQGRSQLRLGAERRRQERRDHPRRLGYRRFARHGDRRRRARDRRAGRGSKGSRLHARPGLLFQPGRARLPRRHASGARATGSAQGRQRLIQRDWFAATASDYCRHLLMRTIRKDSLRLAFFAPCNRLARGLGPRLPPGGPLRRAGWQGPLVNA
jgi:diguanylate cyclase (GGDEF)-like protein